MPRYIEREKHMKFNFIFLNDGTNVKYSNGYIFKGDYMEMHIYNKERDIIVLFDSDDFLLLKHSLWSCSISNITNKAPVIFTYGYNEKISLGRFILRIKNSKHRVWHTNNNPLDYRKANLTYGVRNPVYKFA